jgi:probable F420-dependent oxidoreductase
LAVRNTGPSSVRAVRELPLAAEEFGYDAVWFTDHVVGVRMMTRFGLYGNEWLEMLTCMSYAAANTSRIRIGSGIMVVGYRDPVQAAKILTTIDCLSAGRLNVGVGVGGYRDEFEALGRGDRFSQRGELTNAALALILRCWEGGEFSWPEEHFRFERPITFAPVPVQQPRPPIYVAGHSAPALRRAARFADVWHPAGAGKASRAVPFNIMVGPEDVAELGAQLDDMAGRHLPRSIRLTMPPEADFEGELQAYAEAGCEEAVVDFTTESFDVLLERAESLAPND